MPRKPKPATDREQARTNTSPRATKRAKCAAKVPDREQIRDGPLDGMDEDEEDEDQGIMTFD